jgi:hypothetical protein
MNTLATHLHTTHGVDTPILLADLTDRTQCKETLDLRACHYVSSLTFAEFKERYCTGKWKDDATSAFTNDVRMYQRRINGMCSRLVASQGVHHPTYKYGKDSTVGRLYVEDGGLQCLSKPLRHLLATADMVDYDIKNAHPAIMLWICKSIGSLQTPYLTEYVTERAKVLEETGMDKMEMLKLLNKDYNNPKGKCPWVQGYIHELKVNKQVVHDIIKDAYPRTTNKGNPISSIVNQLWCEIENRCIQTAIQTLLTDEDKCSMQFDGFQTNRTLDIAQLNELTRDLGLEWDVKEWTKAAVPADFNERTGQCYESVKKRFEESFFLVQEPLMFNYNGKFVPDKDFFVLSKTYSYITETGKESGIHERWICDPEHRHYKTITSEPYNPLEGDPTPDHVFNEAEPFAFSYVPQEERDTRAIADLQYILTHLCTEETEVTYLMHFIADILQNPRRNPEVLIVFKGHAEGVGKDTINKTLAILLGGRYVGSVADLNMVFGGFNPVMDGKLVLQFNECESKQGHANWDVIKDQVTASTNTIKQKYLVDKPQPNYMRIFVSSNNHNPTGGGRRPLICQTRVDIKIAPEWFEEYYGTKLRDQHYLDSLGSDLLDMDLSGVNIRKPPQTEVHQNKGKLNIKPIHVFLQRLAEGEYDSSSSVMQLKEEGMIGCNKKWMLLEYRSYHEAHYFHNDPAVYKRDMANWVNEYVKSITWDAKVYVDKKQVRCVKIDTQLLVTSLKNGGRYTDKEDEEDGGL